MNKLINALTVAFALAVAGVCLAGLASLESVTAQNVESAYVSLHAGGQ